MKLWFLFTLSICFAAAQNNQPSQLGIGFVIPSDPYQFEDGTHSVDIYDDVELTKKNETDQIFPYFYKPDYGLYHFICLEKTNEYYKVLINDSDIGFMPNNDRYLFKSWESILLNARVARLSKENLITSNPSPDDSDFIENNCEFESLIVTDVIEKDGEYWLSISFSKSCDYNPDNNTELAFGWIRCRNTHELLVEIHMLC